jgi:hypothetical protein
MDLSKYELIQSVFNEKDELCSKEISIRAGIPYKSCSAFVASMYSFGYLTIARSDGHKKKYYRLPQIEKIDPIEKLAISGVWKCT